MRRIRTSSPSSPSLSSSSSSTSPLDRQPFSILVHIATFLEFLSYSRFGVASKTCNKFRHVTYCQSEAITIPKIPMAFPSSTFPLDRLSSHRGIELIESETPHHPHSLIRAAPFRRLTLCINVSYWNRCRSLTIFAYVRKFDTFRVICNSLTNLEVLCVPDHVEVFEETPTSILTRLSRLRSLELDRWVKCGSSTSAYRTLTNLTHLSLPNFYFQTGCLSNQFPLSISSLVIREHAGLSTSRFPIAVETTTPSYPNLHTLSVQDPDSYFFRYFCWDNPSLTSLSVSFASLVLFLSAFQGMIPDMVNGSTKLRHLRISPNLTDTWFADLCTNTSIVGTLISLDVGYNLELHNISSLHQLVALQELDVSGCHIHTWPDRPMPHVRRVRYRRVGLKEETGATRAFPNAAFSIQYLS